jgi:PAS domain S-box-containing protein
MVDAPMSLLDARGRYLLVNECYERYMQRPLAEIVGRTFADVCGHDECARTVGPHIEQALQGLFSRFAGWIAFPDGEKRYMRIAYRPIKDSAGAVVQVAVTSVDVTQEEIIRRALSDSEQRLQGVVAAMTDYVMIIDRDMHIIWTSPNVERDFRKRLVGCHPYDVMHNGEDRSAECAVKKVFKTGMTYDSECEVTRFDGSKISVWCTAVPGAVSAQGHIETVVHICRDVTERKRLTQRVNDLAACLKGERSIDQKDLTTRGDGRLKILLVEDEAVNLMLMERVLSGMDVQVFTASSGKAAVELARAHTFDLILMDISMPVMDGFETTALIRREIAPSVPIFALTAHALDDARKKAKDAGMNGFLTKPINFAELRALIDARRPLR